MINSNEIFKKAVIEKYAIPQFNITNLEWIKYILEKCEELKSPVILGASEGAIKYMGGYNVVYSIVNAMIKDLNISIPVVLHLDHGTSVDSCKKAIDAGFTSVMIDSSKNMLEENIRITKEVVEYALKRNISIEAEVGSIGGIEDNISANIRYADF
ncbi:MAG: class II fructose-bisphosphate aldolase, partial [Bacilli bacterium]|nr:class II fructose-bisphosphate aldolase [Bacilli bacterium]